MPPIPGQLAAAGAMLDCCTLLHASPSLQKANAFEGPPPIQPALTIPTPLIPARHLSAALARRRRRKQKTPLSPRPASSSAPPPGGRRAQWQQQQRQEQQRGRQRQGQQRALVWNGVTKSR